MKKSSKCTAVLLIILATSWTPIFAYTVLWDVSHGMKPLFGDYQPSGYYSSLASNLGLNGFTVDTTSNGFLVDDPFGYDVIVVNVGSSYDNPYTTEEVTLITDFVNNGGGLLIMGHNPFSHNSNIQPVASVFGVSLGLSAIRPYDTYTTNFISHPIFDGIGQIYLRASGRISAESPSTELAWEQGNTEALIAAATYGSGRVITTGGINCFKNFYYNYADNTQFSINIFEYLAIPEPVIEVAVDIKPGSCPNPLPVNLKGNGVIPVAILGTEDFDVLDIDVATIALEGVSPFRSGFEDVSSPSDGEDCGCTTERGDGFTDLILKFKRKEILNALEGILGDLSEVDHKSEVELYLTAQLMDEETTVEGNDCVRLLNRKKIGRSRRRRN